MVVHSILNTTMFTCPFYLIEKYLVWGRRIPSPLPSRTKPSFVMPIPSLSLFNLKLWPLHLNHDIALLHFHNLNPFQHLPKCPKMRRTRSCSRKDISVATSSIDAATQEPASRNPIQRKCIWHSDALSCCGLCGMDISSKRCGGIYTKQIGTGIM